MVHAARILAAPERRSSGYICLKECTVTLHEPNRDDTPIRADSIDRSIDRSNLDTTQEEARRTISGSGSGSGVRARLHSARPLASLAHKVPNMRCTYIRWDAACSVSLLGALLEQTNNESTTRVSEHRTPYTVRRGPWPAERASVRGFAGEWDGRGAVPRTEDT